MRFVCFYTDGTKYADHAAACAESFAKFDVKVEAIALPNTNDWMNNCMQRSSRLSEMAKLCDDPICLFDADLRCLKDPVIIKQFTGDVLACGGDPRADENLRYSAGVIVFGGTKFGRLALDKWAENCRADKCWGQEIREQIYLAKAIDDFRAQGLQFEALASTYNAHQYIHLDRTDVVILHLVASRELRKKIGGRL